MFTVDGRRGNISGIRESVPICKRSVGDGVNKDGGEKILEILVGKGERLNQHNNSSLNEVL